MKLHGMQGTARGRTSSSDTRALMYAACLVVPAELDKPSSPAQNSAAIPSIRNNEITTRDESGESGGAAVFLCPLPHHQVVQHLVSPQERLRLQQGKDLYCETVCSTH